MNDGSGRIDGTAWWDEEKVAEQLREAVAMLHRHYMQQPVQRDFIAHAENVSAWIAMTSAHSLVEQSLKAVLRKRGRAEAEQSRAGHDLDTLYAALPDVDKLTVERELLTFAGRYGGMPWEGVAEFLSSVARDYTGWRYLLIELPPQDLSTTHPEALLAIAKGLVRSLAVESAEVTATESLRSSKPDERSERATAAPVSVDGMRQKQWREEASLVDGLNKASERLKLHLGENYRLVDAIDPVSPKSASAWMAISCGFSLLEQAVKALLHRRGDPRAGRGGAAGHHIDKLYEWLPEGDKAVIEQGFAAYASLFDAIADSSASEFVRRVGRAYNEWRYLLVERPRRLPSAIHPGALLEVADLVVEILVNETFTDHGMHHVARRLRDRILLSGINGALQARTLERHEQGLAQEAMTPLEDWLREVPNLLTGYAAYLRGEVPHSEQVADLLKRAEERLNRAAGCPGGLDLRRFMERAREQATPLIWDSATGLFANGR